MQEDIDRATEEINEIMEELSEIELMNNQQMNAKSKLESRRKITNQSDKVIKNRVISASVIPNNKVNGPSAPPIPTGKATGRKIKMKTGERQRKPPTSTSTSISTTSFREELSKAHLKNSKKYNSYDNKATTRTIPTKQRLSKHVRYALFRITLFSTLILGRCD